MKIHMPEGTKAATLIRSRATTGKKAGALYIALPTNGARHFRDGKGELQAHRMFTIRRCILVEGRPVVVPRIRLSKKQRLRARRERNAQAAA